MSRIHERKQKIKENRLKALSYNYIKEFSIMKEYEENTS